MEQTKGGAEQKTSSRAQPPQTEKSAAGIGKSAARPKRRRRWWFLPLAMAFGLIGGFLIAETAFRVYLDYKFSRRLGGPTDSVPDDPSADVILAHLVYNDPDPKIVYRFKPGATGRYMSIPVRINSKGYPDEEFSDEKPPGTLRIIGLGDSTMFGWGVQRRDRYMDIVERKFRQALAPDLEVEVIVNAVPGWMAVQEIAAFHDNMLDLDADIVVIQFDPNDLELPSNLYEPDLFSLDRSLLGALWGSAGPHPFDKLLEPDYNRIPRKHRSLVGWEVLAEAYEQLKQTCEDRGISLFALMPIRQDLAFGSKSDPDLARIFETFEALCSELGIGLMDANEMRYPYAGGGFLSRGDPALRLPVDPHASILGHVLMARALLRGLLPPLAEGRLTRARLQQAMERVEREMEQDYPPFPSRGLYHPEYWEDVPVRWTQYHSSLLFKPRGSSVAVNYFVGHPDVSAEKPVVVSLTVGTAEPEQTVHEEMGYTSHRFELGEYEGDFVELKIEVSRHFRESPEGRLLGVGLYPLEFPNEEGTPRAQIEPEAAP